MKTESARRRLALGAGTFAFLLATMAYPVFAADTVTQTITAGVRSASIGDLTLPSTIYQNGPHAITGSMILTVDDSTGTNAGWGVTVQVSAFVGSVTGTIPAANFSVTSAGNAVTIAGQAAITTAATGPEVATTFVVGSLATARRTLEATAAYGAGTYTQALGVSLTIPGGASVGTYTGTLTETFVAAP